MVSPIQATSTKVVFKIINENSWKGPQEHSSVYLNKESTNTNRCSSNMFLNPWPSYAMHYRAQLFLQLIFFPNT